jgi:hypothetical protein
LKKRPEGDIITYNHHLRRRIMERLKKTRKIRTYRFIVSVILAVVLQASCVFAETVIVDFESLATPGTGVSFITNYYEDGFIFEPQSDDLLGYMNTDNIDFPGSTALFTFGFGAGPGFTKITNEDGLIFDLESIMLTEGRLEFSAITFPLTGIKADNSIVEVPVTLDGTFGFETFYFDELISLKELRLPYGAYQYDQLVFNLVPEPGTLTLLATGIIMLLRQKQK